ncbi:hypothetical protein P308_24000 [Pseudomonas piscis]|nr:hypothetical protein P308_24000 [Pseudomonas piscis]
MILRPAIRASSNRLENTPQAARHIQLKVLSGNAMAAMALSITRTSRLLAAVDMNIS